MAVNYQGRYANTKQCKGKRVAGLGRCGNTRKPAELAGWKYTQMKLRK